MNKLKGVVVMDPWKLVKLYKYAIFMTTVTAVADIVMKDIVGLCIQLGVLFLLLNGPIIRF